MVGLGVIRGFDARLRGRQGIGSVFAHRHHTLSRLLEDGGAPKSQLAGMQALLRSLTQVRIGNGCHVALLAISSYRLTGICLCRRPVMYGKRGRAEALQQGIPEKIIVQQDAAEVGVTLKDDTEEIVGLSLEPVGGRV